MKKIGVLSGIGILALALLSFVGKNECQKSEEWNEAATTLAESQQHFINELLAQNENDQWSVDEIVFIEANEEIDLGFDTAEYLPVGFDAYAGMELDLNEINFIEIEEEIDLDFDTVEYLPVGFDAYAGMANDIKISLKKGNDAKSLVAELDTQALDSKIKLTDEDSQTIYFENISDTDYAKKFNMKDLQVGTYYLTIENARSYVVYTLDLSDSNVKITNKEENKTKFIFRKVGDKVYVNLFNGDQQKVDIEILDNQGNVVSKESTKDELNVGKVFNFEKAVKGKYIIRVNDGEDIYYKNITIG